MRADASALLLIAPSPMTGVAHYSTLARVVLCVFAAAGRKRDSHLLCWFSGLRAVQNFYTIQANMVRSPLGALLCGML